MPDQLPPTPQEDLTPIARERRDAMFPVLLAEVRRVRRRRRATRIASIVGAVALISSVLALALLRTAPLATNQPLAKTPAPPTPRGTLPTLPAPLAESQSIHIEIVQSSPDILERLSIRTPSLVQVEYINTDQALALLQSEGDRYGMIEIAGRVEFQLIAQK